ncbi:MAG: GNAT family N-acetyltransferase [Actinobacteria bacterium]|nr:GNAT family N-acetyltransferase [Actinomycetota bacterium]
MHSFPDGYRVRPASPDDVPAIAEVLLADDVQDTGRSVYDADFVRNQWAVPGFDPVEDGRLVLGPGDAVMGFGNVLPESETRVKSWGVVHPRHRGLGIGSALFGWIESRASERLAGIAGATFEHSINDVDGSARAIVLGRGLTLVRSFRHMQIDLDGPRDAGSPPAGTLIRGIEAESDLRRAHAIFVEAFEDEWGYRVIPFEEWRALEVDSPGFDPSLWLLATEGGETVGALNASSDERRGWIGEVGVRRAWRGRGIGSALLLRSFATFAERGTPRVLLNVDFENPTGAMRLYEKVGMRAVRGYDVYEKPIG